MNAFRLDIETAIDLRELAARAVAYASDDVSRGWLQCEDGEIILILTSERSYEFMFECSTLSLRRDAAARAAAPPPDAFMRLPWTGPATVQTLVCPEFNGPPPGVQWSGKDQLTLVSEMETLWRVPREVTAWCLVTYGFLLTGPNGCRFLVSADAMVTWVSMTTDDLEIADRTAGALLLTVQ